VEYLICNRGVLASVGWCGGRSGSFLGGRSGGGGKADGAVGRRVDRIDLMDGMDWMDSGAGGPKRGTVGRQGEGSWKLEVRSWKGWVGEGLWGEGRVRSLAVPGWVGGLVGALRAHGEL
jgi:hypothetical protein